MKILQKFMPNSDRIEIRLTGLDKKKHESLHLAIRSADRGHSLDELPPLTPPAGSPMTIAATQWAAKQQQAHPDHVIYNDGAIIIEAKHKEYVGSRAVDWETLKTILKGAALEVARERPARAARPLQTEPIQPPKEATIRKRLATYIQK